jgi:hypothetical protein
MFRTNSEVLSVPSIILTTIWSCFYNLIGPAHRYWRDRNSREHRSIRALLDFTWRSALALLILWILPIRASGYIYGSGYVRLVRSCFIFGFMLIYSWEHQQYISSLSQYIFCTSLWLKKWNTFPLSSELRKTSNLFSNITTFVSQHQHIWLSVLYSFKIPLIIYQSFQMTSYSHIYTLRTSQHGCTFVRYERSSRSQPTERYRRVGQGKTISLAGATWPPRSQHYTRLSRDAILRVGWNAHICSGLKREDVVAIQEMVKQDPWVLLKASLSINSILWDIAVCNQLVYSSQQWLMGWNELALHIIRAGPYKEYI